MDNFLGNEVDKKDEEKKEENKNDCWSKTKVNLIFITLPLLCVLLMSLDPQQWKMKVDASICPNGC